jgi:uncharacterized protein YaaN involved in tellurite resistance
MARKIKKFGKVINDNPVAMALYEEQKALYAEIKTLQTEERNNVSTWAQMEGKYSIGTVADPWAGQGFRGYDYKYPSQEIKAKEQAERDAYYAANVMPLRQKIDELSKQAWALDEPLCVAVCGYGVEEHRVRTWLAEAEKELAEQIAYVERLKKELAEIENRG